MLIVDHLTRMREDRICVAVIDDETGKRFRPILYTGHWTRTDVPARFEVGAAFRSARPPSQSGARPMVEDWVMGRSDLRRVGKLSDDQLWSVVGGYARSSIAEAIPGLAPSGATFRAGPREGTASLGAVRVSGGELVKKDGRARLEIHDGAGRDVSLPLTDLRFHLPDGRVDTNLLRIASVYLGGGEVAVVSLGLAREYKGWHWLQANNLFFAAGFADHPTLR